MNQTYIWTSQSTARAMLDAINNHERLPIVGVNAKTGEQQPDKCLTTKWADAVTEYIDGTFGFPRIPEAVLDKMGISQTERGAMLAAYAPVIVDNADLPLSVAQQYALDHPELI